jgi:hypothetical protein
LGVVAFMNFSMIWSTLKLDGRWRDDILRRHRFSS